MIKLFLTLLISVQCFAQQTVFTDYLGLQPITLPSVCNQGAVAFSAGSSTLNVCSSSNNWTAFSVSSTSPMTTTGDMIYENSSLVPARLAIGSGSSILGVSGGLPTWIAPPASSPLTTTGDLYGFSTTNVRIPVASTTGYVLTVNPSSTVGVAWQALPTPYPTPVYPIALNQGGTGIAAGSSTAAFNALSPLSTSGDILYENASLLPVRLGIGSSASVLTVSSGLPSWQPLPTPYPTPVYPISLSNGGTGVSAGSSTAAFNALSPMSTSGDIIYENSSLNPARLGIGSSTNLLTVSAGIPAWEAIPTWNQSTTGNAANVTGIVALINGGTGVAAGSSTAAFNAISPMSTTGDIIYENASNVPVRLGIGSSNNALIVSSGIPAWGAVPLASSGAVSGVLPLANGGTSINAGSTTALFSSLSPATTAGDLLYENSTDTGITRLGIGSTSSVLTVVGGLPAWSAATGGFSDPMTSTGDMIYSSSNTPTPARLGIGSSGSVLSVVGGLPSWQASIITGTVGSYASAYFGTAAEWTTTSSSYVNPTNDGTPGFTVRQSNNLTLTAAASSLPGITFTPSSNTAVYLITASMVTTNTTAGAGLSLQLTDGTNVINNGSIMQQQSTIADTWQTITVGGIYAPATSSPVTVKVQMAVNAGTGEIAGGFTTAGSGLQNAIEFSVVQINPPPLGVVPLSGGGTGVAAGSSTAAFNAISPMSTTGDIIYENSSLNPVRLGIGASGSVLTVVSGIPSWGVVTAARYYATASSLTSALNTIAFTTKAFDSSPSGAEYSAGGIYTCPVTGDYTVHAAINSTAATVATSTTVTMSIFVNGAAYSNAASWPYTAAASKPATAFINDIVACTAGQTICIQASSNGTTPSITASNTLNYFSISLEH